MVTLLNYTYYDIKIFNDDGELILVVPHVNNCVARVKYRKQEVPINGLPVKVVRYIVDEVQGLPEPSQGVFFIVDREVAEALPDRTDLLISGPNMLEYGGITIGCKGLIAL